MFSAIRLKGVYYEINFEEKFRKTNKIVDGDSFTVPPLYSKTQISMYKDTKNINSLAY